MKDEINTLRQPIGFSVPGFKQPAAPSSDPMRGRFCSLERLRPDTHARDLYDANVRDTDGRMWTYLPYGPFESYDAYRSWMDTTCLGNDPLFLVIVPNATGKAAGVGAFMRVDATNGVVEIGHLSFSPLLQRTPAATEALVLMIERVFESGYRRCEWKCNALNEPSRTAALRLGFKYEGLFRQAGVVKGRNRDTAWFSIIDGEWPALKTVYAKWLDPSNFDGDGKQKVRLSEQTRV